MIITKTPFRISFCGGGSDLPSFYREHGGCVVSTSINRYMYITIHPNFYTEQTTLKYSQTEIVDDTKMINHAIFRQVLNEKGIHGVEISSIADVPSGTGLGSSSAFTVGLLHSLYCYMGKYVSKTRIAEEACDIEINKLGNPIGKQDQYASACGGLNMLTFHQDDSVTIEPLIVESGTLSQLQDNLMVFYTGKQHDANEILSEQQKGMKEKNNIDNLIEMCKLAKDVRYALETNHLDDFGRILDEGWRRKKELASGIANSEIDDLYSLAIKNGALGGKVLGAGGGGFLMLYCEKDKQDRVIKEIKLKRFPISFEKDGTSVVYIGDKYWE